MNAPADNHAPVIWCPAVQLCLYKVHFRGFSIKFDEWLEDHALGMLIAQPEIDHHASARVEQILVQHDECVLPFPEKHTPEGAEAAQAAAVALAAAEKAAVAAAKRDKEEKAAARRLSDQKRMIAGAFPDGIPMVLLGHCRRVHAQHQSITVIALCLTLPGRRFLHQYCMPM